jgi:hypothetical protein
MNGTPNVRQEARHQLACTACRQLTRTVLYVVANGDLVAVLEGCTTCRSGIYHAMPKGKRNLAA